MAFFLTGKEDFFHQSILSRLFFTPNVWQIFYFIRASRFGFLFSFFLFP